MDAEKRSLTRSDSHFCADCAAPLTGIYCAECGQHRVEPPRTFWALMREWFAAYFNLEHKLWSTLRVLVLQPGELSLEYFRGRRTRYFPPLKLYLTMSILFFTLAALRMAVFAPQVSASGIGLADDDLDELPEDEAVKKKVGAIDKVVRRVKKKAAREHRRVSEAEIAEVEAEIAATRAMAEQAQKELPAALQPAAVALMDKLASDVRASLDKAPEVPTPKEELRSTVETIGRSSPRALFFFLPLFAGVYAFLFRKQSFYVESFVFTLHLHSFFLALGILGLIVPSGVATVLMFFGMALYTGIALRKVFRINKRRTITATIFAALCYLSLFAVIGSLSETTSVLACILAGKCT